MTRINLVDPKELCDQHLLAEWRELTRIPNSIVSNKLNTSFIPSRYTVRTASNPSGGVGHVKFFINKLKFLHKRYNSLLVELHLRGFSCENFWPQVTFPSELWGDYLPTIEAINLNRERIKERFPKKARYYRQLRSYNEDNFNDSL